MTQTVTITDLRNNIFDLLAAVEKGDKVLEVKRDGRKVAMIKPFDKKEFDWEQYKIDVEKAVAHLSKFDWSDVLEMRKKTKVRRYKGW